MWRISDPISQCTEVMQPTKAQKTSKDTTLRSTEQATKEPQPLRRKISAVTLPNGTSITPYTNGDTSEDKPIIFDNEGYDETQLLQGMKHESNQMKLHDVYDEVDASTVDDNIQKEAMPTRWVHRKKGPGVRSRIVAKGYTEKIEDEDSVYTSTAMFTTLRTLLALQMSRPNWVARLGDVSTAFLHAPIAKSHDGKRRDVYLWPPKELCPQQDKIWRLKKAMYGLRSSPKAWQDYLAEVLQKLSFVRLTSTPMRLATATSWSTWTIYWYLETRLRSTPCSRPSRNRSYSSTPATSNLANHNNFLEETSTTSANFCNLGLKDSYIDNMIEESGMTNCNTVTAPGIAHYKPTIEDEALLDHEQHRRYRRIVGKLQWLAHTRPDIAYSTKELARDLTAPTELSQKRVKHLLRYLHGAKRYKFTIEPTTTLRANTNNILDLDVHVDADWAGCPTKRKSTSGFNIIFLGTTVAFGSRTLSYNSTQLSRV